MAKLLQRIEKRLKTCGYTPFLLTEIDSNVLKAIERAVEEVNEEFPHRCSAWQHDGKSLADIKECWNCKFSLDCSVPKFLKNWFGNSQ